MSYKAGISAAIADMKERNGSSLSSIKKWMQAKLPADKKWMNTLFLTSLKSGVTAGEFVQIKVRYRIDRTSVVV
jgi:histone H1/5